VDVAALVEQAVALIAHPASVTEGLVHSLDALIAAGVNVTAPSARSTG
jgi:hypothetical protein